MSAPFKNPTMNPPKARPQMPEGVLAAPEMMGGPSQEPGEAKLVKKSRWDGMMKRVADIRNPLPLFVFLVVFALALAFIVALADPQKGLGWLFGANNPTGIDITDVGVALAPILALALAIERIIETVFDLFERATAQVAELGSVGGGGYEWIMAEYNRYQEAFYHITDQLNQVDRMLDLDLVKRLEAERDAILLKMENVRDWIDGIPKDPVYISLKRTLSIWSGLFLGSIVAVLSANAGIFRYLNIEVPRILDMFVTGFVIGAGSGPMHSIIGILNGAKDTLSSFGKGTALRALELQIKEMQGEVREMNRQPEA